MFARVKLVPTGTERAERYFEGISQGGSLYDADVGDIPILISDLEWYTTAGTSDIEGPSFEPSDTEGSDSDGRNICPARTRQDRRYTELMDVLRELQEEVRKSNEKRDQQHQELLDLILGLQGSTSHARTRGTQFDDPPFDDEDGHLDFSPSGRTSSHQGDSHQQTRSQLQPTKQLVSDQQGPGVTPQEEVTRGISGTDTSPMEIEKVPQQVFLPDQPVHSQNLIQSTSLQHKPPVDPSAEHFFIHSTGTEIPNLNAPKELTPAGYHWRHSSSLQRTPVGDIRGQSPSIHRTSGGNTRG
ncbi:hypothetical protein LWI28_013211 [Acer negundo]|uniref:Uncharacterized protein n=1 Tax=Acer negundo TaxID=4023 RepID=A0AAD5P626_ACENE|nr:hypothetical protein LWI28_013211 [Acer negundo]